MKIKILKKRFKKFKIKTPNIIWVEIGTSLEEMVNLKGNDSKKPNLCSSIKNERILGLG